MLIAKEHLSDFQTWLFGSIHSESLQSKHQFLTSNASFEQAIISVAYSIYRREIVVLSCRKLKKRLKEPWASSKGSMTCRWWLVHISAVCFHPSILHSVIRASRAIVGPFAPYSQAMRASYFLHAACWWPSPQAPVMQSKLCGCEVSLRHPPPGLTFQNEKKPYTDLPQRT